MTKDVMCIKHKVNYDSTNPFQILFRSIKRWFLFVCYKLFNQLPLKNIIILNIENVFQVGKLASQNKTNIMYNRQNSNMSPMNLRVIFWSYWPQQQVTYWKGKSCSYRYKMHPRLMIPSSDKYVNGKVNRHNVLSRIKNKFQT